MPKSSKDMQAQLSAAQARLEGLDIPAARATAAKAEADYERALGELTSLQEARRPIEEVSPATERHRVAGLAKTMARREANRREQEAHPLRIEIERLTRLLTGDDRVKQAKQLLKSVAQMVEAARVQVTAAEGAVATIDGLIQAEMTAFDAGQRSAAAQLLALVKAKTATADVPTASRDKITTMEMAKAEALAELSAAQAALAAAEARHAEVEQELLTAQADVAALAHEVALAAYVEVLAAYAAAHVKAHRSACHTVDPRALAADLAAAAQRGS